MKIQTRWLMLLLIVSPMSLRAELWEFGKPISVTLINGEKIFHHLESSGRRNIAISADTVAVAWEDNRDGMPRIYLARKNLDDQNFSSEVRISGGEAYEPSLVALSNNRFAIAWEQNSRIHLRLVTKTDLGPVITLGKGEAMQPSLTQHKQHLMLAYSQREDRYPRIWIQHIETNGNKLHLKERCAVDVEPARDEQLYPTTVSLADRVIVSWEDRRPGHTIIMAAQNKHQTFCQFSSPQRISEGPSGQNAPYGKGHGVSRVALAQYGHGKLLAAWADKRDFREGYDIYAAQYTPDKEKLFGPNSRVQDSFGGVSQQWHTTVTGDPSGRLVVGWDDNRDGDANIMLSWLVGDSWSDNFAVPGASNKGEQNHPSISLDEEGNLHLAWIERSTIGGQTKVRYLFGKIIK